MLYDTKTIWLYFSELLEHIVAFIFELYLVRVVDMLMSLRIKREVIYLLEEMEVLDKLDRGMNIAVVKHHFGASKLMISFIKEDEDRIRGSIR